MTPEAWEKVTRIFDKALELEPMKRAEFLDKVCGADTTLRGEVESLLAAEAMAKADSFIDTPSHDLADLEDTDIFVANNDIAHYRIEKSIGRGGMGEVFLATDKRLNRLVAIKKLPNHLATNPVFLKRFRTEAQAAATLNHPNVATIYSVEELAEKPCITMEYIDGVTLARTTPAGGLDLGKFFDIAIGLARALEHAHDSGVIHRDIKPANVLITNDGVPKILDFGLAQIASTSKTRNSLTSTMTQPGQVMGTPSYMSPEQAEGKTIDNKTDIFSFGVVLYEALTGEKPFAGNSRAEVVSNILKTDQTPVDELRPDVPRIVSRLIDHCLQKDRDKRIQTMREVRRVLEEEKDMFETGVSTGSLGQRLYRETQPYALSWKIAAGIVLLIAVGAVGAWFLRSGVTAAVPILTEPFVSEKLSATGTVFVSAISPDGKKVVYSLRTDAKEAIWLREIDTGVNIPIIEAVEEIYSDLEFSPDGNSIYFSRSTRNLQNRSSVYRISIFGGIPEKISDDATKISISTDGKRVVFFRCPRLPDEWCSLWIADAKDGKNDRKLLSRTNPIRIGDVSISPDGKKIAFSSGQSRNAANEFTLAEFDLETGIERLITEERFFNIRNVVWLPDQSGVLITASRIPNEHFRIWHVSATSGTAEPLTKDSETYSVLSLDGGARSLVSTRVVREFNLHLFDLADAAKRRLLTSGMRAAFDTGGKIYFTGVISGNDDIWTMNSDQSGQRQLTNNPAGEGSPIVSPDGKTIYFVSNRSGKAHVWKMNADGSDQTQVTQSEGGSPIFVSADLKTLYYGNSLTGTLWSISLANGEEKPFLDQPHRLFAFSPDGSKIAVPEQNGETLVLKIISVADQSVLKTYSLPAGRERLLDADWMPDGKSLLLLMSDSEFQKGAVYIQPFDGGPARLIVNLEKEQVSEVSTIALSPDGKSFALTLGGWKHDAVLIKGLK